MLTILPSSDAGERVLVIDCLGAKLTGVLHCKSTQPEIGVLILVGGGQYRVGSHRQFVLLARRLAERGFAVLRFDVRGMGDSDGDPQSYQNRDDDINAAIEEFYRSCPSLQRLGLWGLCDGATSAILHSQVSGRIDSIMAVNPWVSSDIGKSKALLKHYYSSRFFDMSFIRKLLTGKVNVLESLVSFFRTTLKVKLSAGVSTSGVASDAIEHQVLMAAQNFDGHVHFLVSERDLTALEFHDVYKDFERNVAESGGSIGKNISLASTNADHTFSAANEHRFLCEASMEWALSMKGSRQK